MAEEGDFLSRWSRRKRSRTKARDTELSEIIEMSRPHLPERNIEDAKDLLDHNEPGVALELICTQLHEYDADISPVLLEKIQASAARMDMPASTWTDLVHEEPAPEDEDEAALLERLGLPVPETLTEGDDFSAFMKAGVPEFLRKRALRVLWRSNPVLANLDGLNDYDEDFTAPELTQKVLATGYQVGRGFVKQVLEPDEPEAEDAAEPVSNTESESDEPVAEPAETNEVLSEEETVAEAEEAPIHRPRRMRFET